MPIYEFVCRSCDNKFSKRAKISEKGEIKCPECSSQNLKENFTTEVKSNTSKNVKSACNLLFKRGLSGG